MEIAEAEIDRLRKRKGRVEWRDGSGGERYVNRPVRVETEGRAGEGHVPAPEGLISEVSPLVLLQVNCRGICNKIL